MNVLFLVSALLSLRSMHLEAGHARYLRRRFVAVHLDASGWWLVKVNKGDGVGGYNMVSVIYPRRRGKDS